jgi:hypothetical protein
LFADAIGFFFSNLPNLSILIIALALTQRITEMNITNPPGDKVRPAHKADNLAATCEPIV